MNTRLKGEILVKTTFKLKVHFYLNIDKKKVLQQ